MATTRGDLKRHIALEFGLDRTASTDEDLLLNDWANDGVRDVLQKTLCTIKSGQTAMSAGVSDYPDFLASPGTVAQMVAVMVTAAQVNYKLRRVNLPDILDMRIVTSANDIPRYYAFEGQFLAVHPAPASTQVVKYYYVEVPSAMDTDARDCESDPYGNLPPYAVGAVRMYMRWRAATFDQVKAPLTPEDYRQQYKQECAAVRRQVRRMGGRLPVGLKVGYPSLGASAGVRNDFYPRY